MIFFRVSTISTGSAAAFDSAFAPCHGSRLFTLKLLFNHSPAVSFLTSPALRKFFTRLAQPAWPSRCGHSFCPAFRRLSLGGSNFLFLNPPELSVRAEAQ